MAQRFPYNKPAVRAGAKTVVDAGSVPYSFTVHPAIATHYTVMVFHSATAAHPSAWSVRRTVYVVPGGTTNAPQKCKRPTCHEVFRMRTVLPPSALRKEDAKHVYVYFGIHRSSKAGSKAPSFPTTLKLDKTATVSKATRLSATTFRKVVKFSFWVGNDGYAWVWTACTKDSEGQDGIGLPGQHSCGNSQIGARLRYLG
jgi:hypothetical protein